MTEPQWNILAGFFIASITTNLALLKIISDDKIKHPVRVSIIVNGVLTVVLGFFSFKICGVFPALAFIIFSCVLFVVLMYLVERRDKKAVWLGESVLSELQIIDVQICYILSEIHENPAGELSKPIRQTLRYILSNLQTIFDLDKSHRAQLSVLVPQEIGFRVVAYEGIPPVRLKEMEENFKHGKEANCLAGHAMYNRTPIIINDLKNKEDKTADMFMPLSSDESIHRSAIAYPIFRGVGSTSSDPIAILCITSIRQNAFPDDTTKQVLSYYSAKIEILQNCLDIAYRINQ